MRDGQNNLAWLGKVPDHWQVLKLRQLLSSFSEKNHPDMPLLSVVREKGVIVRNVEDKEENHNYIPDDLSKYKLVRRGQFAMNKMKAWQGSYGVSQFDGIVSPAYFVFDLNYDLNLDFFNRAIRSKVYVDYFGQASDGIRVGQWDLSISRMKEIPFLLPPREEQDQIVRFLDWKVSEINKLIGIKQCQINVLRELQYATISTVVLNGVPCEKSISEESSSWQRVRIGHKSWIRARLGWRGLKATEYVDEGYPFLSAFNIVNDKLVWEDLNYINQQRYDESPEIKLSIGDILLVKDGAGIGKCARIDSLPCGEATPNGSLAVITPDKDFYFRYLHYYFISKDFKDACNRIITGMGVPHLTQHFLKNVEVPCPPLEIQHQISDYLDNECERIELCIAKEQEVISELRQLRNRIIADVVTGKIDVRDVSIPEYEFVGDVVEDEQDTGEDADMEEQED